MHCLAQSLDCQKIFAGLRGSVLKVLESCMGTPVFEEHLGDDFESKSVAFFLRGRYFTCPYVEYTKLDAEK